VIVDKPRKPQCRL